MSFKNQFRHKPVKQCQKQRGNMGSVDIGIRHDNNLVIAQLTDIKIISVSFRKATPECVDHCLDFRIGKHLVDTGFFNIQNFSADRHDRLIHTVSRHFGGTTGRISLYDKNLTL